MITVITGNFNKFILFLSVIIIHELGHIIGSVICKWKIEKIILLPFGGVTLFREDINRPLREELIICLLGPLFQIIYYLVTKDFLDLKNIHYNLLIFNLLPIIPLDGSKIFNIVCNKIYNFKKSYIITIYISILVIILYTYIIIFKLNNFLLLLILFFLVFKVVSEIKNLKYIVNRFWLERLNKKFKFKKNKILKDDDLTKMYRDYYHIFFVDKKYITEKEILKKKFDFKRKM